MATAQRLTDRTAWVLSALAIWLLLTLGVRPLMLPDEGRYVGVAFAMLHGDLWTPHLNGLPYFHKPPLMYWIDAAAFALLGPNEWAARLAPALGAWLMGAAVYLDLRRRVGAREAGIALAVLATCPFFFIGGQFANLDMLVAGWVTVTVACAARALDETESAPRRWVVAAWSAAALGVLAKGLIGIVLPALVIVPWWLARRRIGALLRLFDPLGALAFVALVAPWFVVMTLRHPGFLDYFFVEQHFRRYAQGGFNNAQPFWFFVAVLPLLALPWSLWLPAIARRAARAAPGPWAFYGWWCAAVLLFFSLPASKLVGYALPALGPFAALLGLAASRSRWWRPVLGLAVIGCLAALVAIMRHPGDSHRDVAAALREGLATGDRVVLVGGAYFDVPFYARLAAPPIVLEHWDDPSITSHDDWRKELADAGRFAPADANRLLVRPDDFARWACAPGTVWVLSPPAWQPPGGVTGIEPVLRGAHSVLWRGSAPFAPCR
jgi:4-amino-4-deoxy-L-arabinose transferase-like glycosyltransferase